MGHDETYLDAAKRAAMVRTAGLGKRISLTKEDREDVYQDLLMTLLEREAAFDPKNILNPGKLIPPILRL